MKATMVFGEVSVTAEGDCKEIFCELASAAEIFGQSKCAACGSTSVVPVAREVDSNWYYEMRCKSCNCALSFGQKKIDGKLFPRRKKGETWLANGGWVEGFTGRQQTQTEPETFAGF